MVPLGGRARVMRVVQQCSTSRARYLGAAQMYTTQILSSPSAHDPLKPTIPTSDLGLPLAPQVAPATFKSTSTLHTDDLERLHRLSALNPPPVGSSEETELLEGLNELVGLMEAVKAVELPERKEAIGQLLNQGVGEVVIGQDTGSERGSEEVNGRDLLGWATRRKGDYYHSKAGKRADEKQ